MSTTKLDLKKFLRENRYELGEPGGCPEDKEIRHKIFSGLGDAKRWVGSLIYPHEHASPEEGKINIHYIARISRDNHHELGATNITLDTHQIRDALVFREVLDRNNIPYKEYKEESAQNLRKIADFFEHTDLSLLEELARMIGKP